MLKILYAAGRNSNARIQLSRFLKEVGSDYLIKVAAFRKSSPKYFQVDWTLDCLLDIYHPDELHADNHNLSIYYDQVKSFKPDLIISDMEHFTSNIANLLGIPLWQCSSSLINFATLPGAKYGVGLYSQYCYLWKKDEVHHRRQMNMVINSDRNFVYSHLGDTKNVPELKVGFEWIRPYYQLGKKSIPCQHNIIAGMINNNKRIFSLLRQYPDSIAFTEFYQEQYQNLALKNIENQEEYFCNLANSKLFVCEGQTSFLADAFYNNKHSAIMPNFKDLECIINTMYSAHSGVSTTIYETSEDLSPLLNKSAANFKDNHIRYLHEKLMEV